MRKGTNDLYDIQMAILWSDNRYSFWKNAEGMQRNLCKGEHFRCVLSVIKEQLNLKRL